MLAYCKCAELEKLVSSSSHAYILRFLKKKDDSDFFVCGVCGAEWKIIKGKDYNETVLEKLPQSENFAGAAGGNS